MILLQKIMGVNQYKIRQLGAKAQPLGAYIRAVQFWEHTPVLFFSAKPERSIYGKAML